MRHIHTAHDVHRMEGDCEKCASADTDQTIVREARGAGGHRVITEPLVARPVGSSSTMDPVHIGAVTSTWRMGIPYPNISAALLLLTETRSCCVGLKPKFSTLRMVAELTDGLRWHSGPCERCILLRKVPHFLQTLKGALTERAGNSDRESFELSGTLAVFQKTLT